MAQIVGCLYGQRADWPNSVVVATKRIDGGESRQWQLFEFLGMITNRGTIVLTNGWAFAAFNMPGDGADMAGW